MEKLWFINHFLHNGSTCTKTEDTTMASPFFKLILVGYIRWLSSEWSSSSMVMTILADGWTPLVT